MKARDAGLRIENKYRSSMQRTPVGEDTNALPRETRTQRRGPGPWTLRRDPAPALLASGEEAVVHFVRRDLLGERIGAVQTLWDSPAATEVLRGQQADGSWRYRGGNLRLRTQEDYDQLATYTRVRELVEKFGMTRDHPVLARAARYLYGCQTREGDFRGIYGGQYSPNYSAGILELLIKAGYAGDARTRRCLRWLLSVRQEDGGWAVPLRTRGAKYTEALALGRPLRGDPTRPSSHLVTGVVLRAFAAHPAYRGDPDVRDAGDLLLSRFFRRDVYPDRSAPEFWTKFTFPFWFTDLLSSLDSLSRLGFRADDPRIGAALGWFRDRQARDGLWDLTLLRTGDKGLRWWVGLAIARVFRRFGNPELATASASRGRTA